VGRVPEIARSSIAAANVNESAAIAATGNTHCSTANIRFFAYANR
jgi:hypothetical protein